VPSFIFNEHSILKRIAEGDEIAFRRLFYTYHHKLGSFIYRITGCRNASQEITQDVFVKIWINRASLPEIENFKAYLFIAARNHAINCLKQMARERNRKLALADNQLITWQSEENNFQTDMRNLIAEAVEKLPSQQKKVYVLSRSEGMKQQEIAQQLNISLETVKKHMVLALRFLKTYLRAHVGLIVFFFMTAKK
jgi:RNA polymerase sigma-70 factor (family 1)